MGMGGGVWGVCSSPRKYLKIGTEIWSGLLGLLGFIGALKLIKSLNVKSEESSITRLTIFGRKKV